MSNPIVGGCPWCSSPTSAIFHGGVCPRVKKIEYHPWGGIKTVEFREEKPAIGGTPGIIWPSGDPNQWTNVP